MDIVGFPVDSFAAKFVLCTKTKVGLATQDDHSIPGKLRNEKKRNETKRNENKIQRNL
jgi:hypothetical protein